MEAEKEKDQEKAAMKRLREKRKGEIAAASARIKEQNKAIRSIQDALKGNDRTVPELGEATGMPASEVLYYLATLKKYGLVLEGAKDGSYFRYTLAPSQES